MKLVVGLGNPGIKYINNRHNVGHMVVDKILEKKIPQNTVLRKTGVLMNSSGIFVKKLVDQYQLKLPDLWVIHDDLDIALGAYKIQSGKGPKDHKGLLSVYNKLGTKGFWHVRVGVEDRKQDNNISGEEYVLQDFTKSEKDIIDKVLDKIVIKLAERYLT